VREAVRSFVGLFLDAIVLPSSDLFASRFVFNCVSDFLTGSEGQ
jgi:hypothetical protein